MAVALDEPFVVVGLGPGRDSLAEVVDGVVQFGPEALLFEGADEPFGAAVGFWLTNEGGVVSDTEPGDRPQEVLRAVLRAPVMAEAYASSHVGSEPAEAVDDGVVDRLQRGDPVACLGDVGPRFG